MRANDMQIMVGIVLMISWSTEKAKGCARKVLNQDGLSRVQGLAL
jgi:hypothetical protein